MIDGTPWPVDIGITAGGWTLAAAVCWLVIRKLISGDLLTRREADALTERAAKTEQANEQLVEQNGKLMEAARLGTATWQALQKAASDE